MTTITITREIPLDDSWDVIVAGGGPAGCMAATAAAREGARTLLVEATGCLGGMGTSGLMNQWMSFTDWSNLVIRGLAECVFNACKAGIPHAPQGDLQPIDAELLKRVYDEMVTGAGAEVLFNTQLAGVEMLEAGTVSALLLANKAGLRAYRAKVYVDCTGDGDLAAWAGAEFMHGDEHGELMPVTHLFTLCNVDPYAYQYGPQMVPMMEAEVTTVEGKTERGQIRDVSKPMVAELILASGKYPEIPDSFVVPVVVGPGMVGFNAGHQWDIDGTQPAMVSQALIRGRKMAKAFRDAFAEFLPAAFANAHLAATGSILGVRETRRILGDYVLTVEDYCSKRAFPDEICRNGFFMDIHPNKAEHQDEVEGKPLYDSAEKYASLKPGETHSIPYRILTPKGLRNVLVAGRCVSTERPVNGAVRTMPVCLGMGEAAGLAAALAAQGSGDVHQVDTRILCRRLLEEGGYLPGAEAELATCAE